MVAETTVIDNFNSLCEEGFSRGQRPVRLLGMGVKLVPTPPVDAESTSSDQLSFTLDHEV
jgi:hypothetical protein